MYKSNNSAAIFTPFSQFIGGGQQYMCNLADSLSKNNFYIDILSPFLHNLSFLKKSFNLDLLNCSYKKSKDYEFFIPPFRKDYFVFFSFSNHIIPPVFGRGIKNILVLQFPFPFLSTKLGDKLQILLEGSKLRSYQTIICYSNFSKKWIIKRLPEETLKKVDIRIINPSINTTLYKSNINNKKNIILSVGRFFYGGHNKKHKELIKVFKKLYVNQDVKNWEFHMAGYLQRDKLSQQYFEEVKKEIKNLPIILHQNIPTAKLINLYKQSKIFWHATGYDNNENLTPEKSEHFGIVVLEALASGSVPLVANKGALPEIVKNNINGFTWENLDDLYFLTKEVIDKENLMFKIAEQAKVSSKSFDAQNFHKKIGDIIFC